MDRPTVSRGPGASPAAGRPMGGLGRQGALNAGATILPGLYVVAATGAVIRYAGATGYAPWALAVVLLGWLTLLDLGLSQTVVRAAARARAGDGSAVVDVLTAGWTYAVLGLATCLGGLLMALAVPRVLGLGGPAATDASLMTAILAADAAVVMATASWAGVLRGLGRFDVVFAASVVQVAVAVPLLFVLLPAVGLPGAALAQLTGRLAGRATLGIAASRVVPWFRVLPARPTRARLVAVFGFSAPLLLMQLGTQLGSGTDLIIVSVASGATAAGLYAAGSQLVRYGAYLVFPLVDVVYPRLAALDLGARAAGRAVLLRSLFLGAIVGAVAFGGLLLEAEVVLRIWAGDAAALSVAVLVVYAVAYLLITPAHLLVLAIIARGQHRTIALVVLGEAVVNVLLSLALVRIIGPIGPAISTLLVVLVDDLVVIPILAGRRLGIPVVRLLVPALAGIAVGAAILLPTRLIPGDGVEQLAIRGGVSVVGLGAIVWLGLRRPLPASSEDLDAASPQAGFSQPPPAVPPG